MYININNFSYKILCFFYLVSKISQLFCLVIIIIFYPLVYVHPRKMPRCHLLIAETNGTQTDKLNWNENNF